MFSSIWEAEKGVADGEQCALEVLEGFVENRKGVLMKPEITSRVVSSVMQFWDCARGPPAVGQHGELLVSPLQDDLLSLKVVSVLHHLSIKRAIQVLRINNFEPNCLRRRPSEEVELQTGVCRRDAAAHVWRALGACTRSCLPQASDPDPPASWALLPASRPLFPERLHWATEAQGCFLLPLASSHS